MAPVSTEHIEITPGVCGGKPRIAGHRITVQNIAIWHERMGMGPEEIAVTYPSITLADVYAALAYYHDHREEIRAGIKADEEFVAELREEATGRVGHFLGLRLADLYPGDGETF